MIMYEVWYREDFKIPEGRPLVAICFPAPNARRLNDIPKDTENLKIYQVPDGWLEFGDPVDDIPLLFPNKPKDIVERSSLFYLKERRI